MGGEGNRKRGLNCNFVEGDEVNEYEEKGDRKNACYLALVVVTFVPENGTNVEITRRSPIQILPLQPNKNGMIDTITVLFFLHLKWLKIRGFENSRRIQSGCFEVHK